MRLVPATLALVAGLLAVAGSASAATLSTPLRMNEAYGVHGVMATDTRGLWYHWRVEDTLEDPAGRTLMLVADGAYYHHVDRFLADGTRDTTFGGRAAGDRPGEQTLNLGGCAAEGMQVGADSSLWVHGHVVGGTSNQVCVQHFLATGAPDPSFGQGGLATGHDRMFGSSLLRMSDGRLLVGGSYRDSAGRWRPAIASFLKNGTPDMAFGGAGTGTATVPGIYAGNLESLALQPDGRIVGVGTTNPQRTGILAVRLGASGAWDNTFDGNGVKVIYSGSYTTARFVTVQPSGRIVVGAAFRFAGCVEPDWNGECVHPVATLVGLTPSGAIATTFGSNGYAYPWGTAMSSNLTGFRALVSGSLFMTGNTATVSSTPNLAPLRGAMRSSDGRACTGTGQLGRAATTATYYPAAPWISAGGRVVAGSVGPNHDDDGGQIIKVIAPAATCVVA